MINRKKKNLSKANLMAEQTYLRSKGLLLEDIEIDELSTGLAHKAATVSNDKHYDSNTDPLNANKIQTQSRKFDSYVNPDIKNILVKNGIRLLNAGAGGMRLCIGTDAATLPSSEERCSLLVVVKKDGYKIEAGDVSSLPSERQRALSVIIKKIQADINTHSTQD